MNAGCIFNKLARAVFKTLGGRYASISGTLGEKALKNVTSNCQKVLKMEPFCLRAGLIIVNFLGKASWCHLLDVYNLSSKAALGINYIFASSIKNLFCLKLRKKL
jgi:hypothetical protein